MVLFSFFLLIVVTCFVIFKVNHEYQTIEDCKVYVTYKHRHCQTAKGEQRGAGIRRRTAQVLLAIGQKPLGLFNNLKRSGNARSSSSTCCSHLPFPKVRVIRGARHQHFLSLAFEYIGVVGVPQGSNLGPPKFRFFFFFFFVLYSNT